MSKRTSVVKSRISASVNCLPDRYRLPLNICSTCEYKALDYCRDHLKAWFRDNLRNQLCQYLRIHLRDHFWERSLETYYTDAIFQYSLVIFSCLMWHSKWDTIKHDRTQWFIILLPYLVHQTLPSQQHHTLPVNEQIQNDTHHCWSVCKQRKKALREIMISTTLKLIASKLECP